jgi:hypothetical protein
MPAILHLSDLHIGRDDATDDATASALKNVRQEPGIPAAPVRVDSDRRTPPVLEESPASTQKGRRGEGSLEAAAD